MILCASLACGLTSFALHYLSPSLFRAVSPVDVDRQAIAASRRILSLTEQESLRQIEDRPVYPYSVVPGGAKDVRDLKWAADHDPVVASHYAGFDYDHAHVVRLVLARTAYISYRIGNKVYWTRHRVSLKKGETVITDGKMTARSRCANRVEENPQQATSAEEPPTAKFDEPVLPATAISNPPLPYESALLNRQAVPGFGPAPLSLYDPFGNGTWVPLSPPLLPGVCGVGKKPTGKVNTGKQGKGNPCASGSSGGEIPEPGTWLLVASGLAGMYWKTRQRLIRP